MDYLSRSLSDMKELKESSLVGSICEMVCCEDELMLRWVGKEKKENLCGNMSVIKKKKENLCGNTSFIKKKKENQVKKKIEKFIAVLFNKNLFNKSRFLVRKYNLGVKLAARPIQRNSRIVFASVKDHSKISGVKNCLFAVKCKQCEFKIWFKTNNLDVERTMRGKRGKFVNNDSKIRKHMENNEGHEIPFSICEKKCYKNVRDLNIAFDIISRENRIC